jgi:hypothetical protein
MLLLATLIVLVVVYGRMPRPCSRPLTYRIGTVDERFGISRQDFALAVGSAADLWNKAIFRDLFREDPKGDIEVNLVYDYRQAAADKLKALSLKIDNTKGSYDELKARFQNLKGDVEQKLSSLQNDLSVFNARVSAFNTENEAARRKGGVSEAAYRRLVAEKEELRLTQEDLHRRQEELKEQESTLNSLVVVINELAAYHNLDVVNYKNTGATLGKEFQEGHYVRKGRVESITVYHVKNSNGLIRTLAHELGHALGLEHLENPKAIMNRLNQSESLELTSDDLAALKALCKAK